ncbi:hypothetical protein BC830DRAFT_88464 [Chytriomyces sp. MP71]|nr:hypothetical protein BC830DRAFT_88464 [Chytriomyces sp. MP71]
MARLVNVLDNPHNRIHLPIQLLSKLLTLPLPSRPHRGKQTLNPLHNRRSLPLHKLLQFLHLRIKRLLFLTFTFLRTLVFHKPRNRIHASRQPAYSVFHAIRRARRASNVRLGRRNESRQGTAQRPARRVQIPLPCKGASEGRARGLVLLDALADEFACADDALEGRQDCGFVRSFRGFTV